EASTGLSGGPPGVAERQTRASGRTSGVRAGKTAPADGLSSNRTGRTVVAGGRHPGREAEVGQDLPDHDRVLDGGHHVHATATPPPAAAPDGRTGNAGEGDRRLGERIVDVVVLLSAKSPRRRSRRGPECGWWRQAERPRRRLALAALVRSSERVLGFLTGPPS